MFPMKIVKHLKVPEDEPFLYARQRRVVLCRALRPSVHMSVCPDVHLSVR